MNTETLIQKLRGKGVKQAEVARALQLPPATVCRIFGGEREFTLDEAVRLIEQLGPRIGIDQSTLLRGEAA